MGSDAAGPLKLFVNYGRYYEYIPLDIADRALSSSQGTLGRSTTATPRRRPQGCDANTRLDGTALINGVTQSPNRKWGVTGPPYASYVDPDLKSPANDEIVAGAEYEVLPNARAGVTYTYRNLVRTVEDMSNNDGQTYFIGNPGSGIADAFPTAKRTYDAVTVLFTKNFPTSGWRRSATPGLSCAGTTTASSTPRVSTRWDHRSSIRTSTPPSTCGPCS